MCRKKVREADYSSQPEKQGNKYPVRVLPILDRVGKILASYEHEFDAIAFTGIRMILTAPFKGFNDFKRTTTRKKVHR
jgi:hypothetical protein